MKIYCNKQIKFKVISKITNISYPVKILISINLLKKIKIKNQRIVEQKAIQII